MTTITTNLNVQVKQGPQMAIPPIPMEVEAYDKIDIKISSGSNVTVNVQPGDGSVTFLLIVSSLYTQAGTSAAESLTYTPDDKGPISLDAPQIYLGKNSISVLLGKVNKITFSNKLPTPEGVEKGPDANVSILVGRDAT